MMNNKNNINNNMKKVSIFLVAASMFAAMGFSRLHENNALIAGAKGWEAQSFVDTLNIREQIIDLEYRFFDELYSENYINAYNIALQRIELNQSIGVADTLLLKY